MKQKVIKAEKQGNLSVLYKNVMWPQNNVTAKTLKT